MFDRVLNTSFVITRKDLKKQWISYSGVIKNVLILSFFKGTRKKMPNFNE